MKESFISFFLLLFLSVAAWGEVTKVTVNGIAYKIDTEAFTAEVTYPNASEPGTSEYTGAISIPSTITYDDTEYNVTAIGDKAFRKASITSLTIPGSVLSLGTESLRECTLASLSLPEGLLSIGSKAIYKLPNITELTVPNSVTTLEDYALAENSSLTTITFGENNGNNNWGAWVCWRSSGAYTIYLNCKKKPKLYERALKNPSIQEGFSIINKKQIAYNR